MFSYLQPVQQGTEAIKSDLIRRVPCPGGGIGRRVGLKHQ